METEDRQEKYRETYPFEADLDQYIKENWIPDETTEGDRMLSKDSDPKAIKRGDTRHTNRQ